MSGHEFDVPAAYLIPQGSYPSFLPNSEADAGFIFNLNPDAALAAKRSVLVEERAALCSRAKGTEARVNGTVCASEDVPWRGLAWTRSGDETFWSYSPEGSDQALFVNCFKMEMPGHPGLCHATLPFDDLALTIDLNDDELPRLASFYDAAISLLRKWER